MSTSRPRLTTTGDITIELVKRSQSSLAHRSRHRRALEHLFQASNPDEQQKLNSFQRKHQLQGLQCFDKNATVTLRDLEKEMALLISWSEDSALWTKCSEQEKLLIEKYKLAIMKTTEKALLSRYKRSPALAQKKPIKKSSKFKWFLYFAFLSLEIIPMIWGGYEGIVSLMAVIPGMSELVTSISAIVVCAIETVLYYAVMGPLLKEGLGITSELFAKPKVETYGQQLATLKSLDQFLIAHNKMPASEYKQAARLLKLFSKNLRKLQDYQIYQGSSLESILPSLHGKGMIVIGSVAYFAKDHQLILKEDGSPFTMKMTKKELTLLAEENRDEKGKIQRTTANGKDLDKLIEKYTASETFHDETKINKFKESSFKKGLRWTLTGLNLLLNLAGGYFFAISLLGAAAGTAALIGTPAGWAIIALVMIGQIALRLTVRSNAMVYLLSPTAEKHDQIREQINQFSSNDHQYDEILREKRATEHLRRMHHQVTRQVHRQQLAAAVRKSPDLDYSYKILDLPTLSSQKQQVENARSKKLDSKEKHRHLPSSTRKTNG